MFRKKETTEDAAKGSPFNDVDHSKNRTRRFCMIGRPLGMPISAMGQAIVKASNALVEIVMKPVTGKVSDRLGRSSVFIIGALPKKQPKNGQQRAVSRLP